MSIFDTPEYKERWAMYQSALDAGIPIVSTETCAIICAMLLVWGNTAEFTHNHRLVCDFGLGADGNPLRFAHHPGWHSCREPILNVVNTDGCVWAEVEIPADGYHIRRMNISGITKTREPIEWYISQKLRIVRVITDEEVQEIRQKHGEKS